MHFANSSTSTPTNSNQELSAIDVYKAVKSARKIGKEFRINPVDAVDLRSLSASQFENELGYDPTTAKEVSIALGRDDDFAPLAKALGIARFVQDDTINRMS